LLLALSMNFNLKPEFKANLADSLVDYGI